MASKNNPKSVEQLIREHSQASVIKHGSPYTRNMRRTGLLFKTALAKLSDRQAIEQMVRQYA